MKVVKLKDICTKGSSSLKQKDVQGKTGKYPVFGASGLIGYIDSYHQEKEYIGIVKDGSGIGRVMFLPPKSSVIGTLQYILPKPGYDINYIGYCLKSLDLASHKQGAAIPHIYFRDYGEKLVNVEESLDEQRKIVERLNAAFDKIIGMQNNAEQACKDAKAIYLKELELAMAPQKKWQEATLKTLCSKIGSGATPRGGRKIYIQEGCSLIRSLNVHKAFFKYDELAHITDQAAQALKGVTIHENDVLFNITGASIARCCVVPSDILPARVNQHVSILRTDGSEILPDFLCYVLNSPQHQKSLLAIGENGATRQAITKADLEGHLVRYPDIKEQKLIVEKLKTLSDRLKKMENNYAKLIVELTIFKQAILKETFE